LEEAFPIADTKKTLRRVLSVAEIRNPVLLTLCVERMFDEWKILPERKTT
jgi:hypothetical protein